MNITFQVFDKYAKYNYVYTVVYILKNKLTSKHRQLKRFWLIVQQEILSYLLIYIYTKTKWL